MLNEVIQKNGVLGLSVLLRLYTARTLRISWLEEGGGGLGSPTLSQQTNLHCPWYTASLLQSSFFSLSSI